MPNIVESFVRQIRLFGVSDLIDICVVAYIIFQLIRLLRETRAIQLVKGLLALVGVYLAANILQLRSIIFIMQNVFQIGAIALIVLFQPELRKVLEQVAAPGSRCWSGVRPVGGQCHRADAPVGERHQCRL